MPSNANSLTHLLIAERPSLLRLAQRIAGNEAAAEDVAQSLWLKVARIDDDPPIINKRAFLFRMMRNLAFDYAKAERRRVSLFAEPVCEQLADDVPLADKQMLDREELLQLQAAIAQLSPRTREVLRLRRIEGLSAIQIAQQLGMSRQMVSRHIAKAMEHCLEQLNSGA